MDMNDLVLKLSDMCGNTSEIIKRRKRLENKFKEIFNDIPDIHYEKFTIFPNKISDIDGTVKLTFKECYVIFVYSYRKNDTHKCLTENCLINSFIRSRRDRNNKEYKLSFDFLLGTDKAGDEISRTLNVYPMLDMMGGYEDLI